MLNASECQSLCQGQCLHGDSVYGKPGHICPDVLSLNSSQLLMVANMSTCAFLYNNKDQNYKVKHHLIIQP